METIESIVGEKPQSMKEWMGNQYKEAKEELMPTEADIKRYQKYIQGYKDKFHQRVQDIKEGKTEWKDMPEYIRDAKLRDDNDPITNKLMDMFGLDDDMTYEEGLAGVKSGIEEVLDNTIGDVPIIGDIIEKGLLDVFDWAVTAQAKAQADQGKLDMDEFQEITYEDDDGQMITDDVTHKNDPDYLPNFQKNYVFDSNFHKQSLLASRNLLKKILKGGELDYYDTESYEKLKNVFQDVIDNKKDYSYDTITKLQRQMITMMPQDIRDEYSEDLQKFLSSVETSYKRKNDWRGVINFGDDLVDELRTALDSPPDDPDPTKTKTDTIDPDDDDDDDDDEGDEEEEDDDEVKESKIEPKAKPSSGGQNVEGEPRYRWRGEFGNTDEVFFRDESEIAKRNLVIEMMNLKETIENNNELMKRQQITYDLRYGKTYPMPRPEPIQNTQPSQQWRQMTQPIMIPQYVPTMRPFNQNARDESSFGQYQGWTTAYPDLINTRETMANPLINPSNADIVTHGIAQELSRGKVDWITNERWAGGN